MFFSFFPKKKILPSLFNMNMETQSNLLMMYFCTSSLLSWGASLVAYYIKLAHMNPIDFPFNFISLDKLLSSELLSRTQYRYRYISLTRYPFWCLMCKWQVIERRRSLLHWPKEGRNESICRNWMEMGLPQGMAPSL